ncbi:MAG: nucleoside triphosphate pyrophosphohydrolase [Bdellovibrionales bacterium]|nr:nucleoside triphosphate pyrophosphohydrolase [Bdellovibrionales bacterium]
MTNPLERLKAIVAQLRDPVNGCPWDKVQTHQTLTQYVIEEAYEVVEAIEDSPDKLEEELGDLLLQIYLHSQIASEEGRFSIESIADQLCEKLIRRHPHVFGDGNASTPEEVKQTWEAVKRQEKKERESGTSTHLLDDLPGHLPSLMECYKIGKKVSPKNFDWDTAEEVLAKVREELGEVEAELATSDPQKLQEEIGDLLFTVAQLARKVGFEPESTLKAANRKFKKRFAHLEDLAMSELQERDLANLPRETLETLWQKVKAK